MLKRSILFCLALGAAITAEAGTIPGSSCTFTDPTDHTKGFVCALFPSDGSGNFSGDVIVNFPVGYVAALDPITAGYLVLVSNPSAIDPGSGADPNMSDWTQVLEFHDAGDGSAQYLQLFTVGCANDGNVTDRSCFPTYSTITNSGYFFDGTTGGGYVYDPCPDCSSRHVYAINFASETPEPTTFAIAAGGILFVAFRSRRRRNSAI